MNGSGEVRFRYQEITFHYFRAVLYRLQRPDMRPSLFNPRCQAPQTSALFMTTRAYTAQLRLFCAFVTDIINVISPDV